MLSHTIILIAQLFLLALSKNDTCYLPQAINCQQTPCSNYATIIGQSSTLYECNKSLILKADNIIIDGGKYLGGLNLTADTIQIKDINVDGNLTISSNMNITIEGTNVVTDSILIGELLQQSDNVFDSQILVQISQAAITCLKFVVFAQKINIQQSTIISQKGPCLYKTLNIGGIYVNNSKRSYEIIENIFKYVPFNIFILTNELQLIDSRVNTTLMIVYTNQMLNSSNSIVNTSSMGCKLNMGMGKGLEARLYNDDYCTSGGSSSGYGTYSQKQCFLILQYFMFLTHSFPYLGKGPYVSTGSGGYGYGPDEIDKGGGGGIIFMSSNKTINTVGSQFLAEGGSVSGDQFVSAGSGGTISIFSRILSGSSSIFSVAGGSSYNNNGSGSGGLAKISAADRNFNSSSDLFVNISQGYQPINNNQSLYSNGIFYGTFCLPGYYTDYLFCKKCPVGSYNLLGSQICIPCPIVSSYSISNTTGNNQISECFSILQVDNFSYWVKPGKLSWLSIIVYVIAVVVFLMIGIIIKNKYKKKLSIMETEEFSLQDRKKNVEETRIITEKLKSERAIQFEDLMYHVHRITLIGRNTPNSPWMLPESPPEQIKKYILLQGFMDFSFKFNKIAKWSKFEKFLSYALVLIYPFCWLYYDRCKKQKYKKLLSLFEQSKEYNLLNNYDFEDKNMVTIKISKNTDYTICYIDFMVYDRIDPKYFYLATPFIISLSGQGNFLRPFYLEDRDVFFNSLFYIVNRTKQKLNENEDSERLRLFSNLVSQKKRQENSTQLIIFLKKFNRIAISLDLSSPINIFTDQIIQLIKFIGDWNQLFFNQLSIQLDLILMVSKIKKSRIVSNQIHILTNRDEQSFRKFMKITIPSMNKADKYDLKLGLFVYNPQQEIKKSPRKSTAFPQGWVTQDMGLSEQQSMFEPFLNQTIDKVEEEQINDKKNKWLLSTLRSLSLLRYYLFCHRKFQMDKDIMQFLLVSAILCQALLVFIWSIKLEYPYIFVNLITPFIGILWIVSGSYGIGKLFLIMNSMALFDEILTIFIECPQQGDDQNSIKNVVLILVCQIINILINILIIALGTRFITVCRKLSASKMFK